MKTSINGFVVIAVSIHDSTRMRVWMFDNDVDANKFLQDMSFKYSNKEYFFMKRASVSEIP